jgi:hypothetical protein
VPQAVRVARGDEDCNLRFELMVHLGAAGAMWCSRWAVRGGADHRRSNVRLQLDSPLGGAINHASRSIARRWNSSTMRSKN